MFSSRILRRAAATTTGAASSAVHQPSKFMNKFVGKSHTLERGAPFVRFDVKVTDKIVLSATQEAKVSMARVDGPTEHLLELLEARGWVGVKDPKDYPASSTIDVGAHAETETTSVVKHFVKDTEFTRTLLCSASLVKYIDVEVTDTSNGATWKQRVTIVDPPQLLWLKLVLGIIFGLLLATPYSAPQRPAGYEPDEAQCEKMEEILRWCTTANLTVLSGQRGQGKTATAKHVACLYHFWYSVIYIDAKDMNNETLVDVLKHYQLFLSKFWEHAGVPVVPCGLSVLAVVFRSPFAFGAAASFFVSVATRPRVFIIDDFTANDEKALHLSPKEVQGRLAEITVFAKVQQSLLLSSNEGINGCFLDVAPGVRDLVSLPDPSPATIEKYLIRKFGFPKDDATKIVNYADEHLPRHWSRSFRFYCMFGIGKLSDYLLPKEDAPNDEPLKNVPLNTWAEVATNLDLATAPVTRPMALAYSPAIEPEKRTELLKLLGVPDDAIPENCPRRLALAHALAARKEKLDAHLRANIVKRLACDVTQLKLNKAEELIEDGDSLNAFVGHLAPILKKYDKGFHNDLLASLGQRRWYSFLQDIFS